MNHWQKIGKEIKAKRELRGWSQQELGERCNMHKQHISNIETGNRKCSVDKLQEITTALECELVIELREA